MTRFNFVEDRDALPVDDGDDEERRDVVADGQGVRVRLMHADSAPPVTWVAPVRARVADAAPPAFDWSAFHKPGHRTFEMLRDAADAMVLDAAAGDPVEAARADRKRRMSDAWRNPAGLRDQVAVNYNAVDPTAGEASGGQQSTDDPEEVLAAEAARANQTQGGVYGPAEQARDAYKRRTSDAWRRPPGIMRTDASVTDTARPFTAPVAHADRTPIRDAREAAYAAKQKRLEDAWRTP